MNDLEPVLRKLIREEVRSALEEMLPHFQSQHVTRPVEPEQALLLSTRDAAKRLTISERTLFSLTQSGQLPCVRLGTSKRYSVETIRKWIQDAEGATEARPTKPPRKSISGRPQTRKPIRQKTVKRTAAKGTPKKKSQSLLGVVTLANSNSTAQRKQEKEDQEQPPNPLSLLLDEMGVDRAVLLTIPRGDLMRIAGVDLPTFHGWRYLGRSVPEEAIEKLREHFRRFRKPE